MTQRSRQELNLVNKSSLQEKEQDINQRIKKAYKHYQTDKCCKHLKNLQLALVNRFICSLRREKEELEKDTAQNNSKENSTSNLIEEINKLKTAIKEIKLFKQKLTYRQKYYGKLSTSNQQHFQSSKGSCFFTEKNANLHPFFIPETPFPYEGDLVNKQPCGFGKVIYSEKFRYEGHFLNGKKHGPGRLIIADETGDTVQYQHHYHGVRVGQFIGINQSMNTIYWDYYGKNSQMQNVSFMWIPEQPNAPERLVFYKMKDNKIDGIIFEESNPNNERNEDTSCVSEATAEEIEGPVYEFTPEGNTEICLKIEKKSGVGYTDLDHLKRLVKYQYSRHLSIIPIIVNVDIFELENSYVFLVDISHGRLALEEDYFKKKKVRIKKDFSECLGLEIANLSREEIFSLKAIGRKLGRNIYEIRQVANKE